MLTDPELLRRTAITTLAAHALVDGGCRVCGVAGVCPYARRAANALDFLGDPEGWLVTLSRQASAPGPAVLVEVLAGLQAAPP
ncbi:hypothetical protein NE236_02115 [Actinoallomurus purpureus]|uniref:hypothetical protein n=1 Tax=Actinoallomurus purpureus TaxID=478114 RepID=UPI0020926FF7|nr:hypothetical protein [Actinoallomurus purpureus]MCO6003763.1 hypothetical protein [Actinoallomurus purpureus]